MLRLTVTVVQVMSDAQVIASIYQEDPYGPPDCLGEARLTYDLADRLDSLDEVSALISVLHAWSDDVLCRQSDL